jgi:hypothetical protein
VGQVTVQIRLLGTIEALIDGSLVDLRGPRQRRLLGLLTLRPDVVVESGQIIDAVWPAGDLPANPRETLGMRHETLERRIDALIHAFPSATLHVTRGVPRRPLVFGLGLLRRRRGPPS